jgi:hypothetical protein
MNVNMQIGVLKYPVKSGCRIFVARKCCIIQVLFSKIHCDVRIICSPKCILGLAHYRWFS